MAKLSIIAWEICVIAHFAGNIRSQFLDYVSTKMVKRHADFQYYPTHYPSDEEDVPTKPPPPAATTTHKHVQFNSDGNRTSYLPSLASPSKALPPPIELDYEWFTEPAPNFDSHPFVDPAYQHELDLMDPDLPKRKRSKSVCHSHCELIQLAHPRPLTIGPPFLELDSRR